MKKHSFLKLGNSLFMVISYTQVVKSEKNKKIEIYNLKNIDCQKKFKELTTNTKNLSTIFDSKDDINILAKRFFKKLDGCIKMSFRKVRINNSKKSKEEIFF